MGKVKTKMQVVMLKKEKSNEGACLRKEKKKEEAGRGRGKRDSKKQGDRGVEKIRETWEEVRELRGGLPVAKNSVA